MGVYQIGEVIRKTREGLGITQEQLCDGICSVETLSRIENGKRAPSRTNFQALMERMGKCGEKFMPFVRSSDMEIIVKAMDINIMLARHRDEETEILLKELLEKINLRDNVNRQFVEKTQALIDYDLGRITVKEKRERLIQALLYTVPNYKDRTLPVGIYSRHELMIFCNIACSYSEEDDFDTAIEMLRQVQYYFNTVHVTRDERAITETLMMSNLGQCLGIRGDTKEAIEIEEKAAKMQLKWGNSSNLDSLLYNIAFENEILEKEAAFCQELLIQAYFVAELNGNRYMMNHIKKHIEKMYGDGIKFHPPELVESLS